MFLKDNTQVFYIKNSPKNTKKSRIKNENKAGRGNPPDPQVPPFSLYYPITESIVLLTS